MNSSTDFYIPTDAQGRNVLYFCGNSLGLQPKKARTYINEELDNWQRLGVEGHFKGKFPWMPYHEFVTDHLAEVVGAKACEVVAANSLTTNLHLMLVPFFRPQGKKCKVLMEDRPFPSDLYALQTHLQTRNLDPKKDLIFVPSKGEFPLLEASRIFETIEKHRHELALILFSGVHYLTGQYFPLKEITELAHRYDIMVGLDLAHAVGNVELKLHDWNVDFAVWCSYKYLNSGPGAIAGLFVHERHLEQVPQRYGGWWGQDKNIRFQMTSEFHPIPTAEGFQLSNPPIFQLAALRASLELFHQHSMKSLRQESVALTALLEQQLNERLHDFMNIITPSSPDERGAQLSVVFKKNCSDEFIEKLSDAGIMADFRRPNIIRLAPAPLYNTKNDIYTLVERLEVLCKKEK